MYVIFCIVTFILSPASNVCDPTTLQSTRLAVVRAAMIRVSARDASVMANNDNKIGTWSRGKNKRDCGRDSEKE